MPAPENESEPGARGAEKMTHQPPRRNQCNSDAATFCVLLAGAGVGG